MKIRPVGAESLHANGWTVMTKLLVTFRIFANAPKDGDRRNILFSVTERRTEIKVLESER